MFNPVRSWCERWLKIPPAPEPPPGDEASTRVFNAAPNFYKYLFFLWAMKSLLVLFIVSWFAVAPAVGAVALVRHGHRAGLFLLLLPGLIGTVAIVLRLVALAVLRLDFEKRWYVVTDRSLRVREGVVSVREMTVTFANIQNISISQGPVQRTLGIADLRVDTAGGGAAPHGKHPGLNLHTAWFRGVNNANEVRELIQQRLRQFKDAGLGDHEDQTATALSRPSQVSAAFLVALRELHSEAAALRATVHARFKSPTPT